MGNLYSSEECPAKLLGTRTALGGRHPEGTQSLFCSLWHGVGAHPREEIRALIWMMTTPSLHTAGDPQCLTVLSQWMVYHHVQQDRFQSPAL